MKIFEFEAVIRELLTTSVNRYYTAVGWNWHIVSSTNGRTVRAKHVTNVPD